MAPQNIVEAARMGCVLPLVVDKFGVWTPSSIEVFHSIVHSSTASNGPPVGTDFCHLVEQLSIQLCCYGISGLFTFTLRMIGMGPMLVGIVTVCIYLMITMIWLILLMIQIQVEP